MVGIHGERIARRKENHAGDLPASDYSVHYSIVALEHFAFAKRQLIQPIGLERIAYIEVGVAVVAGWIVGFLKICCAATATEARGILVV